MTGNDVTPSVAEMSEKDKEVCAIALDEAFGLCGNNEAVFGQIAMMMGIKKDDLASMTPLTEKYRQVVNAGPGASERSKARWVLARAWELTVNEKSSILEAFETAWEEAEPAPPEGTILAASPGSGPVDLINDFPANPT